MCAPSPALALVANTDRLSPSTCLFHHNRGLNISLEAQSSKMTEYMRVSNNVLIKKPATAGVQQQERSENLIMLEGLGETFTMQATYQAKGLEPPAVAEPSLMVSCLIRVPSLKNYSEKFKMICLPSETRSEIELLLAK